MLPKKTLPVCFLYLSAIFMTALVCDLFSILWSEHLSHMSQEYASEIPENRRVYEAAHIFTQGLLCPAGIYFLTLTSSIPQLPLLLV